MQQSLLKDKKSIHILLVDDEQDIIDFLQYNLEREGYYVHTASNGQQAVDLFQKIKPAMIIMDVMMPVMDGITALRELRAREAGGGRRTPVLMVTAHAMTGDKERFIAAGADGYVSKPMSLAELQKEISRVISSTEAEHKSS